MRESYREGGTVKNRTLANLSRWPQAKVDALARVLKDLPPRVDLAEAFEITRSLPHGHVAAVLGTLRRLGLEEVVDPASSRRRDLVTAMVVSQVIAPASKLACARGLRAQTDLKGHALLLRVRRSEFRFPTEALRASRQPFCGQDSEEAGERARGDPRCRARSDR